MQYLDTEVDWPLDRNVIRRGSDSNTFGFVRRDANGKRAHQGWDFYAKKGTPCFAISDGTVAHVSERGNLGLLIVMSIGKTGKYAAYAHLARALVKPGDQVLLGQMISLTGDSGNAAGMTGLDEHLHFEIREKVLTGLGLLDRISPYKVFGQIPYKDPALRKHL